MMRSGLKGYFCQVYLALAKCHPQSREGVQHCFPEWMLMRACVYVWMLFTPHQTGPCKEVQNWGWQPPKPKQPGRMSDVTCSCDRVHAWIVVEKQPIKTVLPVGRLCFHESVFVKVYPLIADLSLKIYVYIYIFKAQKKYIKGKVPPCWFFKSQLKKK